MIIKGNLKKWFVTGVKAVSILFILYVVAVIVFVLGSLLLDKDGTLWTAMMGI